MKIIELLEAQERAAPKTDLRVGDHVTADTSKEQYPGGHKSRSGKVTRIGQTGVHIQPDDGGEREYHPYKIVKKSQGVAEGANVSYTLLVGDPETYEKKEIEVSALTSHHAREEAEAHGYKVFKVMDSHGDSIDEDATAGATSSASIATVSAPQLSPGAARGKKSYTGTPGRSGTKAPPQPKPKTQKPTDNALNMKGTSIFGQPLKR